MTTPILITATFFSLFMIPITLLAQQQHDEGSHPAAVIPPGEGDEFWHEPSSQADLGDGAFINIKVARVSVPSTNLVALTQTLAASGIPVHLHTFEDELIYVISGQGAAIVGDDREEVALEAGSVVYIPIGEWHGVRNANPEQRMEILLVTTPADRGGLGDYFRNAASLPGHPPLDLSEEEFLALVSKYGMKAPEK